MPNSADSSANRVAIEARYWVGRAVKNFLPSYLRRGVMRCVTAWSELFALLQYPHLLPLNQPHVDFIPQPRLAGRMHHPVLADGDVFHQAVLLRAVGQQHLEE